MSNLLFSFNKKTIIELIKDEIFIDIKNYENLYQISNKGRIKSKYSVIDKNNGIRHKKEKLISFGNNGNGYLFVYLWKNNKSKRFYVHRLVAQHFISNPNNYPQVNHIDKNRSNNNVENLEWCTDKYNKIYSKGIKVKKGNIIYNTIKDAAIKNNIPPSTLNERLKNKYYVKYNYNEKYEIL